MPENNTEWNKKAREMCEVSAYVWHTLRKRNKGRPPQENNCADAHQRN